MSYNQTHPKLHKAYGQLAEYYRPFGIQFYHVTSRKIRQKYSDLSGKIVVYTPDKLRVKSENVTREFTAAGKTEKDLR